MKKTILIVLAFGLVSSTAWAQMAPTVETMKPATMPAPAMTAAPIVMAPAMVPAKATTAVPMAPMVVAPMATPPAAMKVAEKAAEKPSQSKGSDPWWKVLLAFLAKAGLAFATALMPVLIGYGVMWVRNKLKIDNAAGIDQALNRWSDMAIKYAEQKVTTLDDDPKDANATKLKMASDFVTNLIKTMGLPKKTAALVEDRIEARLKKQKNGGSKKTA